MHAVLCFGDSITWGRGDEPSIGWVGRFKNWFEKLGYYNAVYNLGVCGDTTQELIKRFKTEAGCRVQYHRDEDKFLILIGIGINDSKFVNGKPLVSKLEYRDNLRQLVTEALNTKSKVALIGLTPIDEKIAAEYEDTSFLNARIGEYTDIMRQVSLEKGVPYLDLFTIMTDERYESMLDDGLHPNSAGYEFLYQQISRFIQDHRLLE